MNKATRILAMCGLGVAIAAGVLALCAGHPPPSSAGAAIAAAAFDNGGFEGTYQQWDSVDRLIAPSWKLWYADDEWSSEWIGPPGAYAETNRKHGGDKSQAVFLRDAKNFDACFYQQIPVTAGTYLQFSAWVYVDTTMGLGDMQTRIGIDPAGGTYPLDIQYELHPDNWDPLEVKGQWAHLSVVMMATSPTATLYACAHPRYRIGFTAYWDDAEFATLPEKLTYLPAALNEHCVVPPGTLWNADLEKDYCILHGYQEVISGFHNLLTAPYWRPYWNDDFNPATAENRQPEANYTDRSYRIHSGSVAQQMGTSGGGNFEAGIYQVVTGTQVSDTLRFTIWGLGWNQHWPANDPDGYNEFVSDYQEEDGLRFRVGIDPYGGESYTSTDIVWSDLFNPFDQWHQFEVTATAAYTRVSVWAYAHPAGYWLKHNQTFWDGANLEVSSAE